MVVRRAGKRKRLLGQRTRGHGDTKNRRGAGSRGGRGLAGSHKHKWSKSYTRFGKEKKTVLPTKKEKAINIDQLMQAMPRLVETGKVSKEAGMLAVDGAKIGYDKLLGKGNLNEKLLFRNMKASKKALEKVEKAGGKLEQEESEEEFEVEEEEGEGQAEEGRGKEGKGNVEGMEEKAGKAGKQEPAEEEKKE